jgi:hypothetical protein
MRELIPWDPYLLNEPSTQSLEDEILLNGNFLVSLSALILRAYKKPLK